MLYQIENKIEEWNNVQKECVMKTIVALNDPTLRESGNEALRTYHACRGQIHDLKILRRKIELSKAPGSEIQKDFDELMGRSIDDLSVCEDRELPLTGSQEYPEGTFGDSQIE